MKFLILDYRKKKVQKNHKSFDIVELSAKSQSRKVTSSDSRIGIYDLEVYLYCR